MTSGRSEEGGQAPRRAFVPTVQLLALVTEDIQGWTSGSFQAHLAFGGLTWRPRRQPPSSLYQVTWAETGLTILCPPPSPCSLLPEHPPPPKDGAAGSLSLPLLGQGAVGTEAGRLTLVFCTCQASF